MDDRELDKRLNNIETKAELILIGIGYKYDEERGFYLPDESEASEEEVKSNE